MKKLLIVGAGGHGRCCLDIARELSCYQEISFLDDGNIGESINDCKVIGGFNDLVNYQFEYEDIFIAIGNNKFRQELSNKVSKLSFNLVNLISKKSNVSKYATLGKGSVVFPGAVVEANVKMGEGCIVTANVTVNHDAVINDYCLIYSNSVIRPNSIVESFVKINSNCVIGFGSRVLENSEILDGQIVNN